MILVFDLGATQGRIALSSRKKLGEVVHITTDSGVNGLGKFIDALKSVAGEHDIQGVVGAVPGQLEGVEGRLVFAQNLPKWLGVAIITRISREFRCPIHITNDVMIGGLGEAHYGAGIRDGVMAYFTVSTGVNAVRIVDGRVDGSIARFEIGSQVIAGVDGHLETLESLTGGAAFEMRRGRLPREVKDPAVWRAEARNLAIGVYNTALHWAPDVVVFGGSMMRDVDLRLVDERMRELPAALSAWPHLEYATLGDLGGLYGAMAWADQLGL